MKRKTASKFLDRMTTKAHGEECVIKENAVKAIEIAEEDLRKKAIIAACNFCIQLGGGCGHIDRDSDYCFECDQLDGFKKEIEA